MYSEEQNEIDEREDKSKDDLTTENEIRVRLLNLEMEYAYSTILFNRVTVSNSSLMLPFKNHVFELKDVELSLRDSFWFGYVFYLTLSRALDYANNIINHQANPLKQGVPQTKVLL